MTDQTHRIAFRCTEDEFYQIKEQASDSGMNVSDYLKWLVINDEDPIEGDDLNLKGGEE